ncbi:hypothetical protein GTN66_05980 [bacterium]|nr:hypothetical protein [bacterium]NIO73945.1 hypothetical protein [bacterium]
MNKIIAGLVILAIGLWAVASWWWFLWDIIRAVIAILFVLSGVTLIGLGLKNSGKKPAHSK